MIVTSESLLVNVNPEIKQDVSVTYKKNPIESLYLTVFSVFNESNNIINNVDIEFEMKDTIILNYSIENSIPTRKSIASTCENKNGINLQIPYLNSKKLYKPFSNISYYFRYYLFLLLR